jgi:hypothetical protein
VSGVEGNPRLARPSWHATSASTDSRVFALMTELDTPLSILTLREVVLQSSPSPALHCGAALVPLDLRRHRRRATGLRTRGCSRKTSRNQLLFGLVDNATRPGPNLHCGKLCPSARPKPGLAQDQTYLAQNFALRLAKNTGSLRTKFRFANFWRRGELNPRPRNLATRRLHACPVPMVSPRELRAGKTRPRLVR